MQPIPLKSPSPFSRLWIGGLPPRKDARMSIEDALVTSARSGMVAAKARAVMEREMTKGCSPELSPFPVALEPPYTPLSDARDLLSGEGGPEAVYEAPPRPDDLVRLQLWMTAGVENDWVRGESFLKQLQLAHSRMAFEIAGNRGRILVTILCHQSDRPLLTVALRSQYPQCRLSLLTETKTEPRDEVIWRNGAIRDYIPPPPYSDLLTRVDELCVSPFDFLLAALAEIPNSAFGIYQVVFQRVSPDHDLHRNIQALLDLQFAIKLFAGFQSQQRFQQQAPSGDLRGMALSVDSKAHNDKPLFAVGLRLGVFGCERDRARLLLHVLGGVPAMFQHGGCPLSWLTEEDYATHVPHANFRELFQKAIVHRPGFLVNSRELVGLVHAPPLVLPDAKRLAIATLDAIPEPLTDLSRGLLIGYSSYADRVGPICIPPELRSSHTHLIGVPRSGKSRLLEEMACSDIADGSAGIALIDPHGDLAERVAARIPDHATSRVIYFNPGNPVWIPLWNPLKVQPGQDVSRVADDFLCAFKKIVTGWGDRLERLLREGLLGVLRLEDGTLQDLACVFSNPSPENEALRRKILERVDTPFAEQFWRHGIKSYTPKIDFAPVLHKLSKLLSAGPVAAMLSQPDSRFDFRSIMDQGLIFVANLSHLGSDVRDTLGSLILSLIHVAALGRSELPEEQRRPFHVYADEAYRFLYGSIEDLIAETRKYRVSLTLAHQFISQLREPQIIDALGTVGTTIVFRVLQKDAELFSKRFGGVAPVQDLITLPPRQAVARIDTEIVRITTPTTPDSIDRQRLEAVVQQSRERWCIHRENLRGYGVKLPHPSPRPSRHGAASRIYRDEEFVYDTL